ncbi:hypothetical protein [Mycobacterium sp. MMS18-G62]
MTGAREHVQQKLAERIGRIVGDHREIDGGSGIACSCGAHGFSDHSRHVADEIVSQLGLMPDVVDEAKKRIRYVSGVLDWELTKLEGAQY